MQALDAIDREEPGPSLKARVERARGEVARLDGRFSDARRLTERALEIIRTLGHAREGSACHDQQARIELSAGHPAAALASLLQSDAIPHKTRGTRISPTTQALLAETYELAGDRDSARTAVDLAEKLGTAEDTLTYSMTHQVRARLALADGDADTAERWARSAVDHALARLTPSWCSPRPD